MVVMPHVDKRMRELEWVSICPTIYRETDLNRVQMDEESIAQILGWKPNRCGMMICGPSRTFKTRVVWMLLHRLYVEQCIWVEAMTSVAFGHECARRFMNGTGEEWVERLGAAPVLFIDDLGKFKLTDRVEAELFGLVEHRVSWGRPIITTVNISGDELADRMSPDRGAPLVARLREFCDVIVTSRTQSDSVEP